MPSVCAHPPPLVEVLAAGDLDVLTGDPAPFLGDQGGDGQADVVRLADPPERERLGQLRDDLGVSREGVVAANG